ncbi:MAG: type IV pilus modification protein PilV [Gammaproteobacteria bacterium]|nr:type IV pilus modification protein PilV [Gammaproteobacteria bacterium]
MSIKHSMVKNRGFSLLEILVSVVVLAIGLLGIAGLQAVGLKSNQSAYMRTQAASQITSILDRMRANNATTASYLANNYNIDLTATPSGDSVAAQDLLAWKNELAVLLPGGDGAVLCDASDICTVTIGWTDLQADGSRADRFFSMTSQL